MVYGYEFENSIKPHMQLNSIYYEHNIELFTPLLSRFELFILTVLIVFFPFPLVYHEFFVTDNYKIAYSLIGFLFLTLLVRKIFWGVKKESVFIIKGLGLQATVTYCSNIRSSKFIPWHLIEDVIINEAIFMQRVIYYLAVLIRKEQEGSGGSQQGSILPLFLHAQPRLGALKEIYSNIQRILRK